MLRGWLAHRNVRGGRDGVVVPAVDAPRRDHQAATSGCSNALFIRTPSASKIRLALRAEAIEWRQTRGAMSGRVAWQFVQDLAGREGVKIAL
jgi:hypothetical protein